MTDREILLEAVVSQPDNDGPRLAMADYLEEIGNSEQAEFIRTQIELEASLAAAPSAGRCDVLLAAESKLWTKSLRPPVDLPKLADNYRISVQRVMSGKVLSNYPGTLFVRRGFVDSISTDWPHFIDLERHLIWQPGMTDRDGLVRIAADKLDQVRYHARNAGLGPTDWVWISKNTLLGADRGHPIYWVGPKKNTRWIEEIRRWGFTVISVDSLQGVTNRKPRELQPTAQPIREVRITDGLYYDADVHIEFTITVGLGSWTFRREECSMCYNLGTVPGGSPYVRRYCPKCHGSLINRWTCDRFGPNIQFVLPDQEQGE